MHLRQLEGVSFVNRRYTKGEPFLSKMVCKRIRGVTLCWVLPIITSRSKKLRGFCCLLLSHFILLFNWNASIFLASKSSVHFGYFSRETSRGSVRPIKTFLHDRFFPCTLVRGNLSNFVKNLQTSSCFYQSDNHGLTQSSHVVFNDVAVTKS